MDAFAVSICKGLTVRQATLGRCLTAGAYFGGFQALMPLIGWALGVRFQQAIANVDHWIAFGLLVFIGGKMLWDAFHEDAEGDVCACGRNCASCPKYRTSACERPDAAVPQAREALDYRELVMLAVATSIDALAVGVTFAFLGVNIWLAAAVIGVTTFALSFVGVAVGNHFGARFERPATIAGGVVLVFLGVKILIEHLCG